MGKDNSIWRKIVIRTIVPQVNFLNILKLQCNFLDKILFHHGLQHMSSV